MPCFVTGKTGCCKLSSCTIVRGDFAVIKQLIPLSAVITNTLNDSRLTSLTCYKVPGFWMVEHQLVFSVVTMNISAHIILANTKTLY